MGLYESLLRPAAFMLDPETVHELALKAISNGWVQAESPADPRLEQTLFGVRFPNPVGLAAGFDKSAAAAVKWPVLGFGFAELGTVTCHAQPGNDKPRLFRLPSDKALINRMGFNNPGAEEVARRLTGVHSKIPLGINLGKSKVTDLDSAAQDYQSSFRFLKDLASYFVVNVSSPNTPGLRSLQERRPLTEIITAIQEVDAAKPLFVKVSPDLEFAALDDILEIAFELRLSGLIATNTTLSRDGLIAAEALRNQAGGLSGEPLRARSDRALKHLAKGGGGKLTLIGVGGIMDVDDVIRKLELGADLVQVYTGWVYGGPKWVAELNRGLIERLDRDGMKSIREFRR